MPCLNKLSIQKEEDFKFNKCLKNSFVKKGKQESIKCKISSRVILKDLKSFNKSELQTLFSDSNLNQNYIDYVFNLVKLNNVSKKINYDDCLCRKPVVLISNLFQLPKLAFLKTIDGLKVDSLFVKLLHKHYNVVALAKLMKPVKEKPVRKKDFVCDRGKEKNSFHENGNDVNVCSATEFPANNLGVNMWKIIEANKNNKSKAESIIGNCERNSSISDADLFTKKYATGNTDSDLLVKGTAGNCDSDIVVSSAGCNLSQEIILPPSVKIIESTTEAKEYSIIDSVFDVQGSSNFFGNTFSTHSRSPTKNENEVDGSFSTKNFTISHCKTNYSNVGVETNFFKDKNSLTYKLNYSIFKKLKSLNLMQVQTQMGMTKEKEEKDKSLNFKTECRDDLIMVKKKNCMQVDLNYLIQLKDWICQRQFVKLFGKYFVCMSEKHFCKMLGNCEFQDIIYSPVFRFGMFESEWDDYDGTSLVSLIFQGGYLLLFHHSVIMDEYFVLLMLNLLKRNKSTASELSKSICFVPSNTYHSWVEKVRSETCKSVTFKGNVNFFSKELEKEDTVFLLESDLIESQCSASTLQIVSRNLHKRFGFHHQKVIVLIGNNVNEMEFSETFYKIQNIETFLINF